MEVRLSNMVAAKGEEESDHSIENNIQSLWNVAISDAVRTSLGPRGMDKMVFWILLSCKGRYSTYGKPDPNIEGRGHYHE